MSKKTVAGAGSIVNPKNPHYSEDQGYSLVEDVNQGPHGAGKGKVSAGHNQNSDDMGSKNELIGISGGLQDPYRAKGSDWPDGKTSAAAEHGQGAGATYENPNGGGKNELITDSENQCGPRHVEDDGAGEHGSGTPVPGNRAARVAANFKVDRNRGESDSSGGEMGSFESLDLQTGHIVGGGAVTAVDDVPDHNVHIPSARGVSAKVGRVARDLK